MSVHAGIDPLAACANGRYLDELVLVERGERRGLIARARPDGGVLVRHRLDPPELDDDLADRLAVTLAPLTDDHEVFARAFTGIVLTSAPDPLIAWERFYRNSLARIDRRPGYSESYQHALAVLPTTTVLDIGAGFGFLSLHLAERGAEVIACDVDPETVRLVRTMSARLGRPVEVLRCDGASVPLPAECVDAVALLHVLEHLDHDAADAVFCRSIAAGASPSRRRGPVRRRAEPPFRPRSWHHLPGSRRPRCSLRLEFRRARPLRGLARTRPHARPDPIVRPDGGALKKEEIVMTETEASAPAPIADQFAAGPPVANAALVGVPTFLVGSIALALNLTNYVPQTLVGAPIAIILLATGVGQTIATIFALRAGESAVASVFGIFGGFWLSYGAFVLGVLHNWYGFTTPAPGASPAAAAAAAATNIENAQKLFLLSWLILVVVLTLVSLRLPMAFTLLFVLVDLALLFVLLSVINASATQQKIGGYFTWGFIAIGVVLFYDAMSAATGGKNLPLGRPIIK